MLLLQIMDAVHEANDARGWDRSSKVLTAFLILGPPQK